MIKHRKKLVSGKLSAEKRKALQIIEAGLEAANVAAAVKKAKLPALGKFNNIYVIGYGKASALMAEELEKRLGAKISKGAVVSTRKAKTKRIKGFKGTHPIPSTANVRAAKEIAAICEKGTRKDLVIALVSGGGSALLTLPAEGITLSDLKKTTSLLIRSKATIGEINAVRKHLSQVKGGKLAEKAEPAKLHALIVSDVVGNDLSVIASGATSADKSTLRVARNVLKRHRLLEKIPKPVLKHLRSAKNETPKRTRGCENKIVLDNMVSLNAMQKKARSLGFKAVVQSSELEGEASHVGRFLVRKAEVLAHKHRKPIALIAGGETTVTLRERGKGGRNQEMVLGSVADLSRMKNAVFASIGSDGIDGDSRAAGAIATSATLKEAKSKRMDVKKFLARNDSNGFFRKLNGEIVTGYTETNVMDFQLVLAWP